MHPVPSALVLLLIAAPLHSAGNVERSIAVQDVTRSYLLHVPPGLAEGKKPVALVLVFHGGGGRAGGMERLTRFGEVADRHGFLLAYPEGLDHHWNDGRLPNDADDVGFVAALVRELASRYPVDPNRVFATGISNGGFFSVTLACRLSDTFAAVASVAATMGEPLYKDCRPARPVSVLFLMGDKDPLVPIGGGAVARNRGTAVSLEAAVRFWVSRDGISAPRTTAEVPDRNPKDGTRTTREIWEGGLEGTAVESGIVKNGGHTWPGGLQYLPKLLVGPTSRDFDASEEIWSFFERYGRKPAPAP